jgi:hypothetical protein
VTADNGAPVEVSPAAVEAAREAGRIARERAASNGDGAEGQAAAAPPAPPSPPRPRAEVPRGGAAPAAGKAEPCGPCEDGVTIGLRPTERALGILGIGVGLVLIAMGVDLATGGALSRLVGLGGSDDGGNPGAR